MMLKDDDIRLKRSWAEVSGVMERVMARGGAKPVSNLFASILTGKEIIEFNPDGFHYSRRISGEMYEKVIYGCVALSPEAADQLASQGVLLHDLPANVKLVKIIT